MDTFIVVVVVGALIFMGFNLVKYAKFIHHFPKENPDSPKENETDRSSGTDDQK